MFVNKQQQQNCEIFHKFTKIFSKKKNKYPLILYHITAAKSSILSTIFSTTFSTVKISRNLVEI